jgi:predicted AlkP superfamily pyrophosphatase or phosphodiesterase
VEILPEIYPRLKAETLPGLDLGEGMIYPAYDGLSIANLPGTICQLLGVPPLGVPPLDNTILSRLPANPRHVILLVLDGLGFGAFQRYQADPGMPAWNSLQSRAVFAPLTSVSPSTTAAALTSLWTGVLPAAHGIIGYELWLKEYGITANMIQHSVMTYANDIGGLHRTGFRPETFMPLPTLATHLAHNGIQTHAYMHASIARSGLSAMHMQQANITPFRNAADLWVSLDHHIRRKNQNRSYTYVYWGELDELAHRYGPDDRRVQVEFCSLSRVFAEEFLNKRLNRQNNDTLVIVTADHGLMHTPRSVHFDLHRHKRLLDMLAMKPSGENRLAYLFTRPHQYDHVREYIEETWPGKFVVLPADQVLASGLMGPEPFHPRLKDRIGDWVVFARGDAYLWWAEKENFMLGRHGGLSEIEMLVPFFAFEI